MSGLSESTEKWLADVAEKYPSKMAALREAVRETREACAARLRNHRASLCGEEDAAEMAAKIVLEIDIGAEVQKKEKR